VLLAAAKSRARSLNSRLCRYPLKPPGKPLPPGGRLAAVRPGKNRVERGLGKVSASDNPEDGVLATVTRGLLTVAGRKVIAYGTAAEDGGGRR